MLAFDYSGKIVYMGGNKEEDKLLETEQFVVQTENKAWCGIGTEVKRYSNGNWEHVRWGGCLCSGGRFVNIVDKKAKLTTYIFSSHASDIKSLVKLIKEYPNVVPILSGRIIAERVIMYFSDLERLLKKKVNID